MYECKYLHIIIFSSLFSYFKNLSEPWSRNKTKTIGSGNCMKCQRCVAGAHQRSQAKMLQVSPSGKLSLPCVWLLSCFPSFKESLVISTFRFGSLFQVVTLYIYGSFFTEVHEKMLGFSKSFILDLNLLIKLFFTWIEGSMTIINQCAVVWMGKIGI